MTSDKEPAWLHHGFREKGWVKTFLLFSRREFWHHTVSMFSGHTNNKKRKEVSLRECCGVRRLVKFCGEDL